jgi:hypothetical protein
MTVGRIPSVEGGIQPTLLTTKGDIIVATGDATLVRQGVGANGTVLTANSAQANGVEWAVPASGKVAQVLSTTKTDTFSASLAAGTNTAITGLSQSITPSSSTSKILVTLTINGYGANSAVCAGFIARGATPIGVGDAAGVRIRVGSAAHASPDHQGSITMTFLDSPATTSAVTYNGYIANTQPTTRTVFVNRCENDPDQQDRTRAASTITVMEILV